MRTVVGIAVAGALGALARYGLEGAVSRRSPGAFPWGTFVVNMTGAFVIEIIDTHERIDAVIPLLDEMVGEGMVTREKVQIIAYRGSEPV